MTRYFFNVFNDKDVPDEEGMELPDAAAARTRAVMEVRLLAADSVVAHGHLVRHHRIEIADASGARIDTVTFGDAIEIR